MFFQMMNGKPKRIIITTVVFALVILVSLGIIYSVNQKNCIQDVQNNFNNLNLTEDIEDDEEDTNSQKRLEEQNASYGLAEENNISKEVEQNVSFPSDDTKKSEQGIKLPDDNWD